MLYSTATSKISLRWTETEIISIRCFEIGVSLNPKVSPLGTHPPIAIVVCGDEYNFDVGDTVKNLRAHSGYECSKAHEK